jgi:hypothetical protein
MKNLYFLAAVAAFALGSCTVEEALDPPADPEDEVNAIGFSTFLDRVPQNGVKPLATTVGTDELRDQGFMVEAYRHEETNFLWNNWFNSARTATPNFMNAQKVTWGGDTPSSWTYSPIKYWPINGTVWHRVSFFAYTPATNVTFVPAGAKNKNPQLHYSMPESYSSQTDLIVDARYNVRGNDDNGKVKFEFDHVLSRIGFQAKLKNDYAPTTITITSLRFYYNELYRCGTYTFNSGTEPDSGDKDNKDLGNWSTIGANKTGSTSSTSLFSNSVTLTPNDPPYNLSEHYPTHSYLMLIPQPNEQAYVRVTYIIHYPTIPPTTQTNLARAYLSDIPWEPGKAYTYTLNIAPRAVTVDVSSKVEDWYNVPGIIDVP